MPNTIIDKIAHSLQETGLHLEKNNDYYEIIGTEYLLVCEQKGEYGTVVFIHNDDNFPIYWRSCNTSDYSGIINDIIRIVN